MSQGLIQGSMREAPLPDIIQLVSQSGKTGCFHVVEDAKKAKIFLKAGRVVHAETIENQGLDAVYEIALWLDGSYHFEETESAVAATITKSNPAILMEMHQRMDEWRVISHKISSLDLYPQSTLLPGESASGVNPREARLLALVTGYYTVKELAEVLGKPVLNVAKDLYGLVMAGHVVTKGLRSGKRPAAAPAPHQAPEPEAPVATAPPPAPEPVATEPVASEPLAPEPVAPEPVAAAPVPEEGELLPPTVPHQPMPEPQLEIRPLPAPPKPPPAPAIDPVRLAKLTHFAQRIAQTAKGVLPPEHHEMVNHLHVKANLDLLQGDGPEAVKNLALAVSRGAVEAGCGGDLVKNLNAHLKALFAPSQGK